MKTRFHIRTDFVNVTEGFRIASDGWQESDHDNIGKIFSDCQKQFGRCTGKSYRDDAKQAYQVGWLFEKRECYSDCTGNYDDHFYLQETWVEIFPTDNLGQ